MQLPLYKKSFYQVTAMAVVTTVFFFFYSSQNFTWLTGGSTRNTFWIIAGPLFLYMPLASIILSFVTKKESLYRIMTIINALLIPVLMYLAFTSLP